MKYCKHAVATFCDKTLNGFNSLELINNGVIRIEKLHYCSDIYNVKTAQVLHYANSTVIQIIHFNWNWTYFNQGMSKITSGCTARPIMLF